MSFSATQVQGFAAQIVAATDAAFPTVVNFRGEDITIKCTSIKTSEKLEDGGFDGIYDATARLSLAVLAAMTRGAGVVPASGETLIHKASGVTLRINKVDLPGAMPEYVLHLMRA